MKRSAYTVKCANVELDRGPSLGQGTDEAIWMLNPCSGVAASRFHRFVEDLPGHLPDAPPAVGLLLCLIGYDCVLTEPDLFALGQAISSTPASDPRIRTTWTSDREGFRHTESRCLSVRTRLASRRLANDINWAASAAELESFLQDIYPDIDSALRTTALDLALTDARTWWYLQLPLCLYSHVRGAFRMPILDEQVLRRLDDWSPSLIIDSLAADAAIDQAHDQVGDRLLSELSSNTQRVTPQTIALIQSVFAVSVNQTGLRLSTHLNGEELRDKLTLVTEMVQSEGWIAAVLLSWSVHLLTVGSIRKVNPAISTLSAYVTALLEPLADALFELKYPPAFFSQGDWYRLFDLLRQRACTGQHAAALASLHSWAVRTFGCDPMPDVMFQSVEATRVHDNLIWPHEQQRALQDAITVDPDDRVSQQVQVLLALGSGGLFRIGELPGLLTSDLVLEGEILRVHIDPGRGLHGGKSRAARRVVRVHAAALISLIWRWRDSRVLESGSSSDTPIFLFGDPHLQRHLYRIGKCVRLVNELLRRATGDDRVSFHTLRHSGASFRAYSLLAQPQSAKAVSPLDELCHELGHSSRDTLWSTYFHLPEFALRAASDRIEAVCRYSTEETAYWLNITPATLRQRTSRAASEAGTSSDLYSQWLTDKAGTDPFALGNRLQPPSIQDLAIAAPRVQTPRDLRWVRHALAAVADKVSLEAACLRLSCQPGEIHAFCLAVQQALRLLRSSIRDHSSGLLLVDASLVYSLQWVHQRLAQHQLRFKPVSKAKLTNLARYLDHHAQDPLCMEAALAWSSMWQHKVLSLHDPAATRVLLRLLKEAGVPADSLVIRVQDGGQGADGLLRTDAAVKDVRDMLLASFGTLARIELVRPRRGHPLRYLVVASSQTSAGKSAPSAAVSMHELHGLLFSLSVFHAFQKGL
uniref:tyrosine-type recombinase/integrase n=1 Tax=Hylemonella sp. TaxID=2066020 RepID=UPI0035AF2FE0